MFSSVITRNITQRSYQALHRASSTSAQPSMSEASEALQHVTEADKREAGTEKPEKRKKTPWGYNALFISGSVIRESTTTTE